VPPILKQLRYPYEKSITKSQIAAVGGQNWSLFLDVALDDAARAECRKVLTWVNTTTHAQKQVSMSPETALFSTFLTGAYHDWLQGGEDEDDEIAEKRLVPHNRGNDERIRRSNERYVQEVQVLEAENRALRDQIEELEKNAPDIAKLDKHSGSWKMTKGSLRTNNRTFRERSTNTRIALDFWMKKLRKQKQSSKRQKKSA